MGLFSEDVFGGMFADLLGVTGNEPPITVPLRILGLDKLPATRDDLKATFRAKVMAAHPDLNHYTIPHLREAAEAAVAAEPDVQELKWARDCLLRKIPTATATSPDGQPVARRWEPRRCKGCDKPHERGMHFNSRGLCYSCEQDRQNQQRREQRAAARADRHCERCRATFTPARADGRYCSSACRQAAYRRRAISGAA